MISMYILCKLNDTDYAYPIFSQFDNYEKAFDEALISCGYFLDQDMQIDIAENRKRISAQAEDNFFVTEIIELNKIAARWPAKAVAQFFTFSKKGSDRIVPR